MCRYWRNKEGFKLRYNYKDSKRGFQLLKYFMKAILRLVSKAIHTLHSIVCTHMYRNDQGAISRWNYKTCNRYFPSTIAQNCKLQELIVSLWSEPQAVVKLYKLPPTWHPWFTFPTLLANSYHPNPNHCVNCERDRLLVSV